ncbi:uncharacterized protein STEHIDRAFT_34578, partial [Stereum hirsutum FP-91666 SS1]|uniref:uncharacterized protein n=1 Tax=Stereum hirsutum (strain FP-91666) TaxID=721885 RepID=UPI000444A7F6
LHDLSTTPTEDTLSLYVAWQCSHIKPESVSTYLSGICTTLEPLFPNIRQIRNSYLVTKTLAGCRKRFSTPIRRKEPLTIDDIARVASSLPSPSYDDTLFLTLLSCGFFALHRLGELVDPDQVKMREPRKRIRRRSVKIHGNDAFSYDLPMHKADRLFAGSEVWITTQEGPTNPVEVFRQYVRLRDRKFPLHSPLFLTSSGTVPIRSWFMTRFHRFFGSSHGGHSMRSGGATFFATKGFTGEEIQRLGRWTSE